MHSMFGVCYMSGDIEKGNVFREVYEVAEAAVTNHRKLGDFTGLDSLTF